MLKHKSLDLSKLQVLYLKNILKIFSSPAFCLLIEYNLVVGLNLKQCFFLCISTFFFYSSRHFFFSILASTRVEAKSCKKFPDRCYLQNSGKTECDGVYVCVIPTFTYLNPNSQCDRIRKWGFWEVCRSWGYRALINEIDAQYKGGFASSTSWGQEKSVVFLEDIPHLTMLLPDLRIPASRTMRKNFLLFLSYAVCSILF